MASQIVSRLDLTSTRSGDDRKEYRLIKLQNGLECMLVSTFLEHSGVWRTGALLTDEQEDLAKKISIRDRRLTMTFDQSRSVRTFSEERLRQSDASLDPKLRTDTKEAVEDAIEEEDELDDGSNNYRYRDSLPSPSVGARNLVKSLHLSFRDSSSKASVQVPVKPQSRQPSLVGVVSGEAGRKLSVIFPSPSTVVSKEDAPGALSSPTTPTPQGQAHHYHEKSFIGIPITTPRVSGGRTSLIETPRERPPTLRLSRMASNLMPSQLPNDFHFEQTNATTGCQNDSCLPIAATPRTHRTSVRSNSMASTRSSFVFPMQSYIPLEADMSTVAMGVAAGSFATPEGLDGLAHFLEHMLFMGSEKYPRENEFDSLLARAGGSSNAFTDTERTVYHFSVPQAHLKECLKVFSQFFVSPLLLPEASLRELNSIESEFALRQNIDECRLQEMWRETSRSDTPYSKFTCGNMQTLKKNPEAKGIEVNKALREYYEKYYVTGNMKFVIISGEPMNELEVSTAEVLKDVRIGPPQGLSLASYGFPWKQYEASENRTSKTIEPGVAAGCCFRVPPTTDMHELQMTWQLPPQASAYKSKPTEYIAHVLGHESAGSVLAELKARGWATGLAAGVAADDGFTNNSGVTLFNVTISLTSAGISQWVFIAGLVFEYIGILKRTGPVKWIHEELKEVAQVQYRFHEELDPRWLAQRLCIHMLPQTGYAKEHFLNGSHLVFEWNPDAINAVLDRLEPESVRIDLISSRLHEKASVPESPTSSDNPLFSPTEDFGLTQCLPSNRQPILEQYTGAPYWVDPIPQLVLDSWRAVHTGQSTVGYSGLGGEEQFPRTLGLPPKNPFISTNFELKNARLYDYSEHMLIGAELRIRTLPRVFDWFSGSTTSSRHISFGKGRRASIGFEYAVVIAYDKESDAILVRYPAREGVRKWHKFDANSSVPMLDGQPQKNKIIQMDNGRTFAKVVVNNQDRTTRQQQARSSVKREDYDEVHELFVMSSSPEGASSATKTSASLWSSFPRVPPYDSCAQPTLVSGSDDFLSLWYLHDNTTFRSPRVCAYLSFLTPIVAESALNAALADLFAVLVFESLNQESYLAFIVDLDFEIQVTAGLGIQLHFSGFSHKLPDLVKIVLKRTFFFTQWVSPVAKPSFPGSPKVKDTASRSEEMNEFESYFLSPDQDAPKEFDTPIFYARLETLLTDYMNAGSRFRSSNQQISSVLFDLLCDGIWTPEQKAEAARTITSETLIDFANKIFATTKVEGLLQGNVDERDASQFYKCVDACLQIRGSKPIKAGMKPMLKSQVVPVVSEKNEPVSGLVHILEAVESQSHSVELFFQIGPDNPEDRVLARALEQLMREPLYSELRTKQQLGYSVKCGVRSVCSTLGFVVEITSDVHGPEVLAADVDEFFKSFRAKIEQMSQDEYVLNMCGLGSQLLEKARNLGEAASRHWNTILAHAFYGLPYVWNSNVIDAGLIKTVATKTKVLDALGTWLDPNGKRRRASVFVVGYGYEVDQLVKSLRKPHVKLLTQTHRSQHGAAAPLLQSTSSKPKKRPSALPRRESMPAGFKCSIM